MDAARAVFFIGYSTADIDIRRLLYDRPALKDKSFFVIGPQERGQCLDPVVRIGLHNGPPATLERAFEELRQHAFKGLAFEVIEKNIGHGCVRAGLKSSITLFLSEKLFAGQRTLRQSGFDAKDVARKLSNGDIDKSKSLNDEGSRQ